ncbi:MAG: phosphopantothenoylcysteine decarboxylase [Myxococcota bacterium]
MVKSRVLTPAPALVTAGATRNPVDAIRYLSAHATGRTGVEIARGLGGEVLLLGSAEACLRAEGLATEEFFGTRDLGARMERWLRAHPRGALVHSAAVGDYELADPRATKIPSGQAEIVLRLVPAPKLVDRVREWAPDCFLASFKAASPETTEPALEAIARAQLVRTRSDVVFANVLGALGTVLLVDGRGTERLDRAAAIAALVARVQAFGR